MNGVNGWDRLSRYCAQAQAQVSSCPDSAIRSYCPKSCSYRDDDPIGSLARLKVMDDDDLPPQERVERLRRIASSY